MIQPCGSCGEDVRQDAKFCSQCGVANERAKVGDKRARMGQDGNHREATEEFMERFAEVQTRKFEEMLDKRLEKMIDSKVAQALEPMNKRLERLEKSYATAKRSNSAPPGAFVPSFLEIKGFVDKFEDAKTAGITKEKATELVENLMGMIPQPLRADVGNLELKGAGPGHYSIKLPVGDNIMEILGVLRKHFRENNVGGRELFVTVEKSPETQMMYSNLGNVKRFLEKEVETNLNEHSVKVFWGRDMCAYLEDSSGCPTLIAEVDADGIHWDPEGLELLKVPSAKAARVRMLAASRRFR